MMFTTYRLAIHAMHDAVGPNAMALTDGTVILNDAMAFEILNADRFDAVPRQRWLAYWRTKSATSRVVMACARWCARH